LILNARRRPDKDPPTTPGSVRFSSRASSSRRFIAQHGETEEKALDLGAHDYLGKPVQTRSLLARVRAVLKRASA
jgi:CheY-like chemotaxis protein